VDVLERLRYGPVEPKKSDWDAATDVLERLGVKP
jgi:hypothetical protein